MSTGTGISAPKKLMTANEFWDFVHRPENESRDYELISGEVIEVSRPTRPHGRVAFLVGMVLELYARGVGKGFVVTNDSGVVLAEDPDTVLGLGVAYFTDVNRFEDITPKWAEVPPTLVAEIRSPNDKPISLIAKIGDYLKNGVKVVWLVDYEERTVAVFRPDVTPEVFSEAQELTGGSELPGFSCRVSELFRLPGDTLSPSPQTSSA